MKKLAILISLGFFIYACGNSGTENSDSNGNNASKTTQEDSQKEDDGKGFGEIKNVILNDPLDAEMVAAGKNIYEVKCAACHKLTDQRVVGPGWAGLTKKRKPEWIMNMTYNPDIMLKEDPVAKELLKECLVIMPNQNLSKGDARDVLEFMLDNDSKM